MADTQHGVGNRRMGSALAVAVAGLLICLGCNSQENDFDVEPLPRGTAATGGARSETSPTRGLGVANASTARGISAANHLARESSPYLLAHAHDPVEWYAWGPEALERARREQKLLFVSVGFSACHWCRSMCQNVFSDPAISKYMNEHFINVLIDREQRPDLDEVFQSALTVYYQAAGLRESGGWPLSLFLTPEGKPLGGGTFFSATDAPGEIGFPTVMQRVVQSWQENRPRMEKNALLLAQGVAAVNQPSGQKPGPALHAALLTNSLRELAQGYDPQFAGFGFDARQPQGPKFPHPARLALLEFAIEKRNDAQSAAMLQATLDRMAAGGLYDHLAGGFHRYCIDREWHVPHFEKMLYENALLIDIYTSAYDHTHAASQRDVVERSVEFVLRDLCAPSGGFFAGIAADSEGTEGKFYVWTRSQLEQGVPASLKPLFAAVYARHAVAAGEGPGVLEQIRPLAAVAAERHLTEAELQGKLAEVRRGLLRIRQQRSPPARDDQVLTAWNGLMIHSLAHAGVVLDRHEYVQAAERAATTILSRSRDATGSLLHGVHHDLPCGTLCLDDYACLVKGLLALHQATQDGKWLNAAQRLTDQQLELFWDAPTGGCLYTPRGQTSFLTPVKHAYDGLLPAGNSVTVRNLLRLAVLTGKEQYRSRARQTLETFSSQLAEAPASTTGLALALGEYLSTQPGLAEAENSGPTVIAAVPPGDKESGIVPAGGRDSPGEQVAAQPKRGQRDGTKGASPGAGANGTAPGKKTEIVSGGVYLSVDRLPAGSTCRFLVYLKIAEPYHINQNPPEPSFLKPTVVSLKSEQGIEIQKLQYPPGVADEASPEQVKPLVYQQRVAIPGTLSIPRSAAGQTCELLFEVKYQACAGSNCLLPKTLQLRVPVRVAAQGEKVSPINGKLFPSSPQE